MTDQFTTTQTRNPWAAVRRTLVAVVGFIIVMTPVAPDVVRAIGWSTAIPWVAGGLAVAAAITRVLAVPAVEIWLRDHLKLIAAAPGLPGNKPK